MSGPRERCWKIRHPQSQQGPQKLKPKQYSMKWLIFAEKKKHTKNTVLISGKGAKVIEIQETQNHWVSSSTHLVHWLS